MVVPSGQLTIFQLRQLLRISGEEKQYFMNAKMPPLPKNEGEDRQKVFSDPSSAHRRLGMKNASEIHADQVRLELGEHGISPHGLRRAESRYLPTIIHEDEHIKAAILGRVFRGAALLAVTNMRVIFFDRIPLFTNFDELPYGSVMGVSHSAVGLFASVTLRTRMGDYILRYVNKAAARAFVRCIEEVCINGASTHTLSIGQLNRAQGQLSTAK
jgi:hypothetical protein